MANIQAETILKYIQAVTYVVGSALITYNFVAVKVDKHGYFWVDKNQLWLAIGVGAVAVGMIIKNWKKL